MGRSVGVLMKQERDHGVFLTTNGSFIRGRARAIGVQVGQEVEFVPMRSHITSWARLGVAVALMLAIMVSGVSVYLTRPAIAAYVTIDINPSVELGIDRNEIVRSVIALNPDAEGLIAGSELVGRPITEALEALMATAAQDGYLKPESEHLIVITTTSVVGQQQTSQETLTAQLDSKVRAMVSEQEQTVVTSMVAAPEVREEARKQGMSVGKLLVAQRAEEAGIHLDPEELRNASLTQSIRSAGGDPSAILKSATHTAKDKEIEGSNKGSDGSDKEKPLNDDEGNSKANSNKNGKPNADQSKPGTSSGKQDKEKDKDEKSNNSGQGSGQSKR